MHPIANPMKLLLFCKFFPEKTVDQLIETAHELGIDGYDLAIRPGHAVNPDNVSDALPAAVRACEDVYVYLGACRFRSRDLFRRYDIHLIIRGSAGGPVLDGILVAVEAENRISVRGAAAHRRVGNP